MSVESDDKAEVKSVGGKGLSSRFGQLLREGVAVETKPIYSTLELELTTNEDGQRVLRLSDRDEEREERPPGNAGIVGYLGTGVANNKDRNVAFTPYRARGIGRDFGIYHQAWLESQSYQDAWGKIEQGLTTSHWHVRAAQVEDERWAAYAKRQAKAVQRVLFGIDGGWAQHVREALYMLVGGFAPFLRVTDGLGQLRALSFRYPSQVRRWVTDEFGAVPLGIEFDGAETGKPYVRMDSDLVVYRFRALGNDFEGVSPMRSVLIFMEAHKLFMELEGAAAEKYGAPGCFIERPADQYDKKDDDALVLILDEFVAADNPIVLLPGGYKVTLTSPSGQMPDFEPAKRYCDEKIATILSAEGALIGLNGKGAYNLGEIKDDQQLRALAYYGALICETLNATSMAGGQSLIASIVASLTNYQGEDLSLLPEGELPQLSWALSPDQDDTDLTTILAAFSAGTLTKSDEDEDWLREKLKMPARVKVEELIEEVEEVIEPIAELAPAAEPDAPPALDPAIAEENPSAAAIVEEGGKAADAALNGAQIASAMSIIEKVTAKVIPLRSGIELLQMAFLIDEERALRLLNALSAPAAGVEPSAPPAVPVADPEVMP